MNRLLDGYDLNFPDGTGTEDSEAREGVSEHTDVESRIAEAIADLSGTDSVPAGFAQDRSAIAAEEIEFSDGGWRTQQLQVADWLHLDGDLDETSAEAFDDSLAVKLGLGANWRQGLAAPANDSLLPRLAERLDRASDLRDHFLSEVEKSMRTRRRSRAQPRCGRPGGTRSRRTRRSKAAAPSMPRRHVADHRVHRARGERAANLSPSFQRADVWPTTTSQQLIESILRGIPLPSIIILDKVDPATGLTSYEVVDGKQRLTSILRFTGRHPVAIETVEEKATEWDEPNLLTTFQNDYPAFKKIWKKNSPDRLTAQAERTLYFPFPLRSGDLVKPLSGALEPLRGQYYCQIRDVGIPILGVTRKVKSLFEQSATDYKIPVITYKSGIQRADPRGLQPLQQAGQAPQRGGDPERALPPP